MQYKINNFIEVRYLSVDKEEGLTDLTITPTDPDGNDHTPVVMTEIGDGLYKGNFIPNSTGWWWVRVTSLLSPANIFSKSYLVGIDLDLYPAQENNFVKFSEDFTGGLLGVLDTTYKWTQATSGSGSVSLTNKILTMAVTAGATDYATLETSSPKFSCGDLNKAITFSSWINFGNASNANNIREFGAISLSNSEGFFVRLTGSQFSVVIRKNSVETITNIANVLDGDYHLLEIKIQGNQKVWFSIDKMLVSYQTANSDGLVYDSYFGVYLNNENSGASAVLTLKALNVIVTDEGNTLVKLAASDENGKIKEILSDRNGRFVTIYPGIQGAPGNQLYYPATSIAPYIVNLWRKVLTYNIPAGYVFDLLMFSSYSATVNYPSRITRDAYLGAYNIGTQVYSIGNTFANTDPQYAPTLEAEVTTIIATTVTLTITYVNQAGTGGRTGTVIMTNADPVGVKRSVTLQAGDFGVKSVTAVSRSGAATGVVQLRGIWELGYIYNNTANVPIQIPYLPTGTYVLGGVGGTINLEITASSVVAAIRQVKAQHNLFLKGT